MSTYSAFQVNRLDTEADFVKEIARGAAKHRENAIVEQLNEFISRGLIEIRTTGPSLFLNEDVRTLKKILAVEETVELRLKDQEYIESLEKENKKLKEAITKIKEVL